MTLSISIAISSNLCMLFGFRQQRKTVLLLCGECTVYQASKEQYKLFQLKWKWCNTQIAHDRWSSKLPPNSQQLYCTSDSELFNFNFWKSVWNIRLCKSFFRSQIVIRYDELSYATESLVSQLKPFNQCIFESDLSL